MSHGNKVADKEQGVLGPLRLPDEDGDVFVIVGTVDPLEALGLIIHFVKSRLGRI